MPITVGGAMIFAAPRRRTIRSNVSLLTLTLSRRDNAAAGRPPSAIARQWTTSSSRSVRLAWGPTAPSNRSAKTRRVQALASQKNRRACRDISVRLPATGGRSVYADIGYEHGEPSHRKEDTDTSLPTP